MPVDHTDLLDITNRLRHRARLLNIIADGICATGDREAGNALGLVAEDMRLDLSTLLDGLEALEARA